MLCNFMSHLLLKITDVPLRPNLKKSVGNLDTSFKDGKVSETKIRDFLISRVMCVYGSFLDTLAEVRWLVLKRVVGNWDKTLPINN